MNSINFTLTVTTPCVEATIPELALECVSAWLDTEGDTLGYLLTQADQGEADCALKALHQLHLGPDSTAEDIRDLLKSASICFETLLESLRALPSQCEIQTASEIPGPESFERHLCWSGARIEETLVTLHHALAA